MVLIWRVISLVMALVTVTYSPSPSTPVAYRSAVNAVSTSYESGKYYSNFETVTLTGDGRIDVVAVALSQVGYREGNSLTAMHGDANGTADFTEYNYNMGSFGSGYGYAWCASFVSWALYQSENTDQHTMGDWCRNHSGDSAYIWREVSCSQWASQLRKTGYFRYSKHNGGWYTPRSGDLIFYDWEGKAYGEDHIGIVVYTDGNTVYTVEGNTSDAEGLEDNGGGVYLKSYPLDSDRISGYGALPYETDYTVPLVDYSGKHPTRGLYISVDADKPVYIGVSDTEPAYTLPRFSMFQVTEICENDRVKGVFTIDGIQITGYIVRDEDRIVQITTTDTNLYDNLFRRLFNF